MANIIYRIIAELFGKKPNTGIKSYSTISNKKLEELLKKAKKENKDPNVIDLFRFNTYLLDENYKLGSKDEIKSLLESDNVSFSKYKLENQDCDNFAIRTWGRFDEASPGFAFGMAFSLSHAFNIFVDKDYNIYIVEPQDDSIIALEDAKKDNLYYPITLIIM